jgi:hypothetical protein
MKKLNFLCLFLIGACLATLSAFAQTNSVPSSPTSLTDFPTSTDALWSYAISFISPFIVWLMAKFVPKIPTAFLPAVTPLVGLGLGFALNKLGGAHLSWIDMAKAGALAVFIRETTNQWVTKSINGERPEGLLAATPAAAAPAPDAQPVSSTPPTTPPKP